MDAILDSLAIRRQVKPFGVKVYEQLGEEVFGRRTELIRGVVLEKMSISPLHAFLAVKLGRWLASLLSPGLHCREQIPLKTVDSVPEPDLAVVFGQPEDYIHAHPTTALLVIEVAISSLELDREKAALYAEAGVLEYWIVLGEARAVEVYLAPQEGRYAQQRRYARSETIQSTALPALTIDLATLFPAD